MVIKRKVVHQYPSPWGGVTYRHGVCGALRRITIGVGEL